MRLSRQTCFALSALALLSCQPLTGWAQSSVGDSQAAAAAPVQMVAASPGSELEAVQPRQGWFWYLDPKKEKKKDKPQPAPAPKAEAPAPASQPMVVVVNPKDEHHCEKKETWDAKCGFVDPGSDFDFQAKERDALLETMSISPENPDAVEAAQRYMKWVVTKASMAANMWYFNMVQHPDLDPTVKSPISELGIALATRIDQASQVQYFNLMRDEGGTLFYFSRDDCAYCHQELPYMQRVSRTMGLQLVNIPLDGKCLPGFAEDKCISNVKHEDLAPLNIAIVPSLYLYVPDSTWIRLATGVTTDMTVIANAVNFFSAYRAAMLNGLNNSKGARPSVTFDPQYNQKPTGVASADGSPQPGEPDHAQMMQLLGFGAQASEPTKK